MKKNISNEELINAANAIKVQRHQGDKVLKRLSELETDIDELNKKNEENNNQLDDLLKTAEGLTEINGVKYDDISFQDKLRGKVLVEIEKDEYNEVKIERYKKLDSVKIEGGMSWEQYLYRIENYGERHLINLNNDPFEDLLSTYDKSVIADIVRNDYTMKKANCDKYDYMIGAFSGVVAGLIDSFFVGMPENSKLGKWTVDQTDKFVIKIAKTLGYKPKEPGNIKIENAISFLEDRYKVNYDQATGKAASDLLGMTMSNHHIKSLGHAPDLVGLIFSIVDQFNSTSHFLDNGRLITFDTEAYELRGNNFIAKLYAGICNWLGHLISDIAGSSTTRRKFSDNNGTGIPVPLFELFQLISKGKFKVYPSKDKSNKYSEMSFADFSVRMFEEGYDARFGMAQVIPVVINELLIRLLWGMKSYFVDRLYWEECIFARNNPSLRRVLLTGHGVLCLVDGIDAAARSKGQILLFGLHLNFVAWKRLAFAGLMEVRALYKDNILDLSALENDLQREWDILYENSSVV